MSFTVWSPRCCSVAVTVLCCVFQAAKLAKMKIPPSEMFLSETDKYSKFDENVSILLFFSELYWTTLNWEDRNFQSWTSRFSVCRKFGIKSDTCFRSRASWPNY